MRELTYEEMEQVDGGVAPLAIGVGIAVAAGAGGGAISAGWQGAVVGAAFAAPAAIFAGAATIAGGFGAAMFGIYSVGTSILGTHAVNQIGHGSSS